MLIECIGLPGSGKTTTSAVLAASLPDARLRSGGARQFRYRWARARHGLGLYAPRERPELIRLLERHLSEQGQKKRQCFNLGWRAERVDAYQRSDRPVISDELLIQGIFVAIGPVAEATLELRRNVESVLLATYRRAHVQFVHIDPPKTRWLAQVWGRPRRRSRFGRSTDRSLMELLEAAYRAAETGREVEL